MPTTKKESPSFSERKTLTISAPNFQQGLFTIKGDSPLVINRMSEKHRTELEEKLVVGTVPKSKKKVFAPRNPEDIFNAARYVSKDGWDGFPAGAIRQAMIRACSIVADGPKMTHMRMSLFVVEDGWDAAEPQIPLIRILNSEGEDAVPVLQKDVGRDSGMNAAPRLIIRPAYHGWTARLNLRWDGDQFELSDVANLLMRVGMQVGIMEGRPASRNSAGQGWGTFSVDDQTITLLSNPAGAAA